MLERGMGQSDEHAPYPWYAHHEPLQPQQLARTTSYVPFIEQRAEIDSSQESIAQSDERDYDDMYAAEMERRRFIDRHEPLVPSNELGDSLGWGKGSHDLIDTVVYISITPGVGTAVVDVPFILDSPPGVVGSVTYEGLSATVQQMLRDARTPRLALSSRFVAYAPSAATMTGNLFAQIITSAGDIIPLGAYPPALPQNLSPAANIAPTALANLSGTQHLQTISVGIATPVAVTFQLGLTFLTVHPRTLTKHLMG